MMKKNHLKIIISPLFSLFFIVVAYSAFSPVQNFSGDDKCYYKITGEKYNNVFVNTAWNEIACNTSLNFNSIPNGIGTLEDGSYSVEIKSKDRTILGDIKPYTSESASDASNKYGITTWGPYKIDTKSPSCILKEVRFLANQSNNQYYNAGNFYYKSNGGSGQFELVIESDDTVNGTELNTSGLSKIQFPTILGYIPTTVSYSPASGNKVTVTGKYIWSGNNSDTGDILNNASRKFCYDEAGNASSLTTDVNTKLVIQDGNQVVNGITTLILSPDSVVPTVGLAAYNALTNGVQYKTGNDGLGVLDSIYSGNASTVKVFAALNGRQLQLPSFQDTGSGLKTFKVKIESHSDKNTLTSYNKSLSTKDGKVDTLSDTTITHNFSKVDLDYVSNDGYRNYSWEIDTLNLGGSLVETDKICDMVGNCIAISTPDFKVVANAPIIATNTSLSPSNTTKGIKHNLDSDYSGNISTMRSNMLDIHTSLVNFEDQYGNAIVPVIGIKDVKLHATFDNTLGCDQYGNPLSGDCIDFKFKSVSSILSGISNPPPGEKKVFNFTLNSYSQFESGNLKIELTSAIPTKDEYVFSGTTTSLYGSLTPKLQLLNLTIKVDNKTGYTGIGENNSALELANSSSNQPNYKWSPIINYSYIDNIYPLVEGQEKELKISNKVTDTTQLDGYSLETKLGTNNFFLQFKDTRLVNGNQFIGDDEYDIFSGSYYTGGNGKIAYSGNDILKFTPKTIGGITSSATNIALYTTLNYKIGSRYVKIPGIQTGFDDFGIHNISDFGEITKYEDTSKITFSEIDIQGISQTGNDTLGDDNGFGDSFKDFSSISLYDIKTNINQNVVKLLAGSNKELGTEGSSTITSFNFGSQGGLKLQDNQIIYFKDRDVILNCGGTCTVSGKKTIIVENGNLLIASDMKYADTISMLGIILIGNAYNGNTSQLRISENITNGVGLVYAEGPILSVNGTNTKIFDGTNTGNTNLVNQLYWKGSFATRNTVGGSIKNGSGDCPYGTFDYQKPSCNVEKAQGYDLIYFRRYARVDKSYYDITSNPMGDNKVPLNIDNVSVKIAGGQSISKVSGGISTISPSTPNLPQPANYNKNAPLIIEYDPNTQTNPPFGFTNN